MLTRINIGPIHPSTHGVLHLVVDLDGDTIDNIEPHIGFLHRGVEKLVETRMYMQSPPYMEKIDYVAPMSVDEAYVAAVEAALGIEVNERAQYARMILLELQRLASHLFFIGALTNDVGQMFTGFMWGFRDRELILRLLEEATGQRMFYVNMRLGGLANDFPKDFKEHVLDTMNYLSGRLKNYESFLEKNPIFMQRMKGVGVLTKEDAIAFGVTGHVLRASGVPYDVRNNNPYYFYRKLNFREQTLSHGDNFARYRIKIMEMRESIRIIRESFEDMPEGDATGQMVKLRSPPVKNKTVTVSREAPRGEVMMYLVAGDQKPYRLSMRTPTFINLHVLNHIAKGNRLADLYSILGSLDVVMADVDR
ncbi:MAG: NADH-quinone oxidoreductase subunit D [Candidatus Marsarchaeota archaeon]|jgi:NADH-quinone oxidoreductase subunit D|nr:NADH-quinone oxidoreductase subunit D [Candidatus Marsarchaeota archaeon]